MRVINILAHLMSLLLGLSLVMASCQREDNPSEGTVNATPIELSPSGEWSDLSRGVIEGLDDLTGDGFVAWANWTKDPEDESIFTNDYSSGVTNLVFGEHGTKVYATDGNGDGHLDTWYYTPKRYWQRGTYTFAAALPATAFNASCVKEESDATGTANITGVISNDGSDILTLSKGSEGFILGGLSVSGIKPDDDAQLDLMYAFSSRVDNKDESANVVSLYFTHAFAQIGIKLTSDTDKELHVKNIKIYGIHKYAESPLLLMDDIEQNTISLRSRLADAGKSTLDNCFAEFIRPEGEDGEMWDIVSGDIANAVQLVKELIVFPEVLSTENPLKIRITYNDGAPTDKHLDATVSSGSWEAGKVYTYTLSADAIEIIGEPEVTPWQNGERTEIEIQ
jgi:hypothetical protein